VRLTRNDGFAITRFADVRAALRNAPVFVSGRGVMMNEPTNQAAAGTSVLNMDDPLHRERRLVLAKPLMPGAIATLRDQIQLIADELVATLVERGSFDGVTDFAQVLPLTLVSRLVGLPDAGRTQMLEWASGIFNVMGNINQRFFAGLPARDHTIAFLGELKLADLLPGSWGARAFALVQEGVLTDAEARNMLFDYVTPALDTTINATSSALWLFGHNPDQWDAVRTDTALIPAAIEEAMRLESPIRAFSRYVARDTEVAGVSLHEGSRVLIVYASANRDERHWPNADHFDIRRKAPHEQLSFGTGVHMCVGMHLARLEMRCLFGALAQRVKSFTVAGEQRDLHNVLRGLKRMEVAITERI
jgi:cytochrome P450